MGLAVRLYRTLAKISPPLFCKNFIIGDWAYNRERRVSLEYTPTRGLKSRLTSLVAVI